MTNKRTFKNLVRTKLKAAKILHKSGDNDTAGYLLGYVVEYGLKAIICKKLNLLDYPDTGKHHDVFASHEFDRLLLLSGYSNEITISKNQNLFNNWSILTKDWKPSIRYNENIYSSQNIKDKLKALENKRNGFLYWARKKW